MIKISKMGEIPPQQKKFKTIYYFNCYNCKTDFTCELVDLTKILTPMGKDEIVHCPLCHKLLFYSFDGFAETVEVEE